MIFVVFLVIVCFAVANVAVWATFSRKCSQIVRLVLAVISFNGSAFFALATLTDRDPLLIAPAVALSTLYLGLVVAYLSAKNG